MWDVVCQLQLRTITTSSWQCASTSCPQDSALWGVRCPFLSKYDLSTVIFTLQSTRPRVSGGCADEILRLIFFQSSLRFVIIHGLSGILKRSTWIALTNASFRFQILQYSDRRVFFKFAIVT